MEVGSKSSQQRGPAFSLEEDKILCNTWLETSQDPIKARSAKSLLCHMTLISKAISKFRGCVQSIENPNPSDASGTDIAKEMFSQDVDEKKGFQHEHVWPILKEAEKWLDVPNLKRQGYDPPEPESLGIDYDVYSSGRPTGRKKDKVSRTQMVDNRAVLESVAEAEVNREILVNMKKGQKQKEERMAKMEALMILQAENELTKLQLDRQCQEEEFMEKDLNSIEDPSDPTEDLFGKVPTKLQKKRITRASYNLHPIGSKNRIKALAPRFQPALMNEPSQEDAFRILLGLRDKCESHHKCKYTLGALKATVHLLAMYIPDRHLPDKAIDLLDKARSKARMESCKKKREGKTSILSNLPDDYWQEIRVIKGKKNKNDDASTIEENDIKLPDMSFPDTFDDDETLLVGFDERLKKRVLGQDEAVAAIYRAV
ncbi:hypothetical protein RHSIM_Rhsim01G0124200 [Rhododendron simsii]|uniref:ClpA/ClpB AAA lid domain-containing protein n=1 Tax=Rhododendron simsii TaxID=118357 RepID=A0A834HDK8_RHOSS|nr:hypothetical protein RHSIM_Rhsim01G0124200 [Rhododendron simsii]